ALRSSAVLLRIAQVLARAGSTYAPATEDPSSEGATGRSPGASAPGLEQDGEGGSFQPREGRHGRGHRRAVLPPQSGLRGESPGRPRRPPGLTHPGYDLTHSTEWHIPSSSPILSSYGPT